MQLSLSALRKRAAVKASGEKPAKPSKLRRRGKLVSAQVRLEGGRVQLQLAAKPLRSFIPARTDHTRPGGSRGDCRRAGGEAAACVGASTEARVYRYELLSPGERTPLRTLSFSGSTVSCKTNRVL